VVKTAAAVALGLGDSTGILDDGDLWDIGIDSLTALELHRSLEMATGLGIGSSAVFEHRTTSALADHLDTLLR
jgi:acyl carrier protein